MEKQKFKHQCLKHPNFKLEYINITNSKQPTQQDLFCCDECFNSNQELNQNNYIRIKYLIEASVDKFLRKWPPVYSEKIIDQLKKMGNENQTFEQVLEQVNSFFLNFKLSINNSIDQQHKKCIQHIENLSFNNKDILKEYQKISKINELRQFLINNQTSLEQKSKDCLELINKSHELIDNNTNLLQNLLNNHTNNNQKNIFDSDQSIQIQEQIKKQIENIELFKSNYYFGKQNITLVKTDWNDGQKLIEIKYNSMNQSQAKLIKQNNGYQNVVSNVILESNKKYIFRLSIDVLNQDKYIYIGLISDSIKNTKDGRDEYLCGGFENINSIIKQNNSNGINKQLKGQEFKLGENKQLEMRVCIADKILEIMDYPGYNYKRGIADKYIQNLINAQNLRLYLGFGCIDTQVTLIESLIVKQFQE